MKSQISIVLFVFTALITAQTTQPVSMTAKSFSRHTSSPASLVQSKNKLTIIVRNIKMKNTIRIGVFRSQNTFLKDGQTFKEYVLTVADGKSSLSTVIDDLEEGEYAIALYQDLNEDKKLNRNFFGVPTEPYGVSNNIRPTFAPPSYDECKFSYFSSQTLTISLIE
jgi:uncharacterized protein (DUF2141 family)